jgi:prepilin-type N-terminal cleavage/methylation domain-containing protein
MANVRRQTGFTLIEIIIVVVILGILAAFALPKITGNVDKARAAESFQVGKTIADAFARCTDESTGGLRAAVAADVTACDTYGELNITDPSAVSQNFTYTLAANATTLTMTATGKFPGSAAADTVTLAMNAATGANAKTCAGRFVTMCKT